ncbi:MAG: ABC transporter substrate-binding protein [Nitratireductor sp.]
MKKETYLKRQAAMLTAGQIDRRQFIMGALAAGIVLPSAMTMADHAMAAMGNKGGTLKFGRRHGSTTDSLDPGTYENGFMTQVGFIYGNNLTEVGPDGKLRSELAESIEASDDATMWTFKLRPGIEFHNGKALTGDDVVASFNHHRGEDTKSAAKGLLSAVKDIKADGNSVTFTLDAPNADFPYIVSDYHILILPSADGKVDATAGVGTGPYIIENFEPGVRLIAKRNPNYFKADSAFADSVELISLLDVTARQNALMNGEVHAIDGVDPKTVALLGRNPNVEILERTGTLHYTLPMRVTIAPFDNYDLRMALKLAVNRQELVDKILLGHGAVGNDTPISPATSFYAELPQREFDPEKAAEHYKKSGHSGTIQLSASDAAFAGAVDAAQLVAASAKQAGIDIEVVREPKDGYWSNVWNKKGWCACYWGGRPTSDWMYAAAYVNDTEWNDTDWRTGAACDRFNELVKAARAELDESKRAAMYKETQEILRDDGGALVPMFANHIMGVSKQVGHGENVAANFEMDGLKGHERWWLNA